MYVTNSCRVNQPLGVSVNKGVSRESQLCTQYLSMFSPDVCHQKLLEIMHREEVKVN